eukprot:Skav221764  [mRNA]  locus=scaffold490:267876:268154:+ [translate_table: standard]
MTTNPWAERRVPGAEANKHKGDPSGRTPLHIATHGGHFAVARYLMEAGGGQGGAMGPCGGTGLVGDVDIYGFLESKVRCSWAFTTLSRNISR